MTTMTTDHLETRLRSEAFDLDDTFAAARARFAERAVRDGHAAVAYEDHDTPIGTVLLAATPAGIVRVGLPTEDHDEVLQELAQGLSPRILHAHSTQLSTARHELDEYFAGDRRAFDVDLDWSLARRFGKGILQATARIPYGHTSTYRAVATEAGSPGAVRAAGTALATNPLPILVPCHRVVRSDGTLGAYRGGPATKSQLLELEHAL
jgi:methylated-DNA-[protein]-cysteine S-methyltransferase